MCMHNIILIARVGLSGGVAYRSNSKVKMAISQAMIILALLPQCLIADSPTVPMMNAAKPGMKMPVVGLGTWGYVHKPNTGVPGEVWNDSIAEVAVGQWLALGGRRIDGALGYGDQVGVGKGVRASGIAREDIFMTSKLAPNGYNETFDQVDRLLTELQMDYVDLLLIHWPGPPIGSKDPACKTTHFLSYRACRQSVWKAMEELYNSGKARAIGVSNFEKKHIEDIMMLNGSIPSVNQNEFHPYWHEDDMVAYCKSLNITYNSYASLGTPDWAPTAHKWNGTILQLPVVQDIAKAHNRSAAQVILHWEWQQGVVMNPRTLNQDHMKENLNFFDFVLTEDEMKQLSSIKPPTHPKVCPDPHIIP